MLKYISFLFIIIFLSCTTSNDSNIYSIEKQIKKLQNKSSKSSLDSSFVYLNYSNSLINKNVNVLDSLKAENNYLLGLSYLKKGVLDSAAIYFHHAIDFINDSIYFERQGNYFEKAWDTYDKLDKYGDCLTVSNKFKSLLNVNKQYRSLSWAYYFEESIYIKMKDFKKALKVNNLRIKIAKEKDTSNIISALFANAKINYYYLNNKKIAFTYIDSIANNYPLTFNQKDYINNEIGVFYYWEGKYKKALTHYLISLTNAKKTKDKIKIVTKYNNIAEVYLELKKNNSAKLYLDSVGFIGINNIGKHQQKSFLKHSLRLAVNTNKDIKKITNFLDSIYIYQNNLYINKYNNELVSLKKSYRKEKILTQINKKSELENVKLKAFITIIILLLFLLTTIALLVIRQRKLNFEKHKLQLQQRLLRSQLNPHFMFNTLYAIQNLIDKEPKKSTNYLMKFSRLLRLILDNSLHNYVLLEDELDSLTKYMELQLLRFPKMFYYKINLMNFEKEDLLYIPPMLIQPFVENSIEHGFRNIDYLGEIIINLSLQSKNILCIIEDNGIGLNNTKEKFKKSTSMSLIASFIEKSTKTKINIINKNKIKDKAGNGLYIEFLIPFKYSRND
ncbi:MAG: histidine kinase [Flavobacteriaceae bacterium]|nr:histidine kinase [Flavobacteriaceae bacterium]